MTKHTPTPWAVFDPNESRTGYRPIRIGPASGSYDTAPLYVGDAGARKTVLSDATLIVRAVNAHETLLEALEKLLDNARFDAGPDGSYPYDAETQHRIKDGRAALKLAKGKE